MNDRMQYINHLNEVVNFGSGSEGITINENDFRNYKWTYTKQYGKVVNFERGIVTKKLTALVYGPNLAETKNRIMEVLEKDILAEKPGRMVVGDYYVNGYFFASSTDGYTNKTDAKITLQFVTDEPYWKKDILFMRRIVPTDSPEDGFDYPYDYPYDFASNIRIDRVTNTAFVPANFKMIIYGPCEDPAVLVGGHQYKVNDVTLESNQYILIDSLEKTVTKYKQDGTKENLFANRDTSSYIFEKIPVGVSSVATVPDINCDITVVEERSEPKWT